MNLGFSGVFLVLGLFLSSSALSVEECRPLVEPMSTFTPRWGRWIFIAGYSDNKIYDGMFKSAQSQWVDFIQTSESPAKFVEAIGIRHPTYCKFAETPVMLFKNSAISEKSGFTCTFHDLPTCDDCLLYHVTSVNNRNLMTISDPKSKEELRGYKAFYLMSREKTVDDSALENFKKQAHCLGYSGEPSFIYNPNNPFCEKDNEENDD